VSKLRSEAENKEGNASAAIAFAVDDFFSAFPRPCK